MGFRLYIGSKRIALSSAHEGFGHTPGSTVGNSQGSTCGDGTAASTHLSTKALPRLWRPHTLCPSARLMPSEASKAPSKNYLQTNFTCKHCLIFLIQSKFLWKTFLVITVNLYGDIFKVVHSAVIQSTISKEPYTVFLISHIINSPT